MQVIKVCINPHCDAIWHNCPKEKPRCKDCDCKVVEINNETYLKKYSNSILQFDYHTGNLFTKTKI